MKRHIPVVDQQHCLASVINQKNNDSQLNDPRVIQKVDSNNGEQKTNGRIKRLLKKVAKWVAGPKHHNEATIEGGDSKTREQVDQLKRKKIKEKNEDTEKDVDSGYAWIILAVMFLINASTFGTARTYGLIYEKMARQDEQSRAYAALPFTIMGATENMAGPLTSHLLARTNSWRSTVFMGSCLVTLSHLLAATCESFFIQILLMGFMCGIGLSFVTISFFQINNAYFVRFRSSAFGLALTGAAFGTFYISPICKYILDVYDTRVCYLILGLILLPNVPLSLLLKPKKTHNTTTTTTISTISTASDSREEKKVSKALFKNVLLVLKTPSFHLIWPTQLLYCWFNFVFSMIIIDFSIDRGLDGTSATQLINIWAIGQLVSRLVLGSLIDLKFLSHRMFTVLCFALISLTIWTMNNIQNDQHPILLLSCLIFILSTLIANLYLLYNGLVFHYMPRSLTAHSIGISSFIGSFFLLPRAYIIGHYRDTTGSYDLMLNMFTYISMLAALLGLMVPSFYSKLKSWLKHLTTVNRERAKSKANLLSDVLTVTDCATTCAILNSKSPPSPAPILTFYAKV